MKYVKDLTLDDFHNGIPDEVVFEKKLTDTIDIEVAIFKDYDEEENKFFIG